MSVKYILNQVGNKTGLNPADTAQRETMLRWLNEAAPELWVQSDMANSLVEQVFKVNGDQTIALPHYVGQLRAVREFFSQIPWHINQQRPRYNVSNWSDMWRNWRIKGQQAFTTSVRNESVLVITVPEVEIPPIEITITGPTENSSSICETVVMDAVSKNTVNQFIADPTGASKNRVNQFDVTISDIDSLEMTKIPNNMLETCFLVVDISSFPWSPQSVSQQDHYVEVLYKKTLPYLKNDGDEFPAKGYDNVLVNKMLQLWAEEQGKTEMALGYDAKATRSLARIHEDQNRATEDTVIFVPNAHDTLLWRLRNRPYGSYLYR